MLPLSCCPHAARSGIEDTDEIVSCFAFANSRNLCCRMLRAEFILRITWDSLSASCSSTAARQSRLQFSESPAKREFISISCEAEWPEFSANVVFVCARCQSVTQKEGCGESSKVCRNTVGKEHSFLRKKNTSPERKHKTAWHRSCGFQAARSRPIAKRLRVCLIAVKTLS